MKLAKYVSVAIHFLGPTVLVGVTGLIGFGVLSAKLESKQKQLYASTQNAISQFRRIADGIAQAKVRVVERHTIKTETRNLPPEVRNELKELRAKVEALIKLQMTVPEHSGNGAGYSQGNARWTFTDPGRVTIGFKLKVPQNANMEAISKYQGAFDYKIAPVPLELTLTKGVFRKDGVRGLQQWFVTAMDKRDNTPLAVKDFTVTIPNLYQKKHWWQKWYITIPAGILAGSVVAK